MNKHKAISILESQINKIKTEEGKTSEWEVQTKSYIKYFFGKDSSQFEYFERFSFFSMYKYDPVLFLKECIEFIKNTGLYKKPKMNFLDTAPNWLIMLLIPFLFSIGLAAGKYSSDLQNIELKRKVEILRDSISTISTNKKINEIEYPNNKNDSIKNNLIQE